MRNQQQLEPYAMDLCFILKPIIVEYKQAADCF